MPFYLVRSNCLICLLAWLFGMMIIAVWCSSLFLGYKLALILLLLWHAVRTIKQYALYLSPQSICRICYQSEEWHSENKAGYGAKGKLNKFV